MELQARAQKSGSVQSFLFEGILDDVSFAAFARHRAARLDLKLKLGPRSDRAFRLSVKGQPDLIDMFEMAMSLGPHDCIVLDVTRTEDHRA